MAALRGYRKTPHDPPDRVSGSSHYALRRDAKDSETFPMDQIFENSIVRLKDNIVNEFSNFLTIVTDDIH